MITKIQNNQIEKPAFTANWQDARKIIEKLPNDHDFFSGLNYTLDKKTVATKQVLLARLDKFADVAKNELKKNFTLNIDMPDFSNFFKNPKKFWNGLRQQDCLVHGQAPYSKGYEYPFERTTLNKGQNKTILVVYEKDSIGNVATFLLEKGKALAAELKKAGLENPKEIEFK